MSKTEILLAGHGGQGILLLGDFIAYSAVLEGKHVAYTPSYGPETRGGKAKCHVVIADESIDTPIAEEPDIMIIMNQPSMDFVPALKPHGLLIYNSSLIQSEPQRNDIKQFKVPATEIADTLRKGLNDEALGEIKDTRIVSNSVMFGAYLELSNRARNEEVINRTLEHFLKGRKESLLMLNRIAIERGIEYSRSSISR